MVIMDRVITDFYDLMIEFMPFFCVPIGITIFSSILKIIKSITQGNIEIGERKTKGEEKNNDQEKKIDIDKDLQRYFNYKE